MFVLKHRNAGINTVAFSPCGTKLAAGGYWGYVQLWDLDTRALLAEYRPGTNNVSALSFAPNNRLFAFNGFVAVYDADTHTALPGPARARGLIPTVLAAAPWPVESYCVGYMGRRGITCRALTGEKLWAATVPAPVAFVYSGANLFPRPLVTAMQYSANGAFVAVGLGTGQTVVLRADTGKAAHTVGESLTAAVQAVALSPAGDRLAVCAGAALRLYALDGAPELRAEVRGGRTHYLSAAWHPSGEFFAVTNGGGVVEYRDADTGKRRAAYNWKVAKPTGVCFDATGTRAACGGKHGEAVVWDVDA
jgi:WD40 repeat protein